MTEQVQARAEEQTPKGLPEGVAASDLSQGQGTGGAPKAPEISNSAPAKEQTEEEKKAVADAEKAKIADAEAAAQLKTEDEDKKTEEEKKDDVVDTEYVSYNDEAADSVVSVLKESGVTAKEADAFFREAATTGDFTKIDSKSLIEKVGKEKANLIILGVKDYYTRLNAGLKESVDAVYEEVGGESNWTKVLNWAKEKAKADTAFAKRKESLNAMFDLNPVAARAAAKELKGLYESDAGNSSLVKTQVHGDSAATDANAKFEPITRSDYLEKVKAAEDKRDYAEVSRLRAQRLFSKKNYNN